MSGRLFRILVAGIFLLSAISLAIAMSHKIPTDPEAFWNFISEKKPYTQWKMWPGHEGIYPGKSPHGAFLKLYVNDIAYKAIEKGVEIPTGAVIVKENYAKDKKTLVAITPMYKKEGYNPEGGDWWWAKYGPKGEVKVSGKVDSCIKCHATQKERDYLFSWSK